MSTSAFDAYAKTHMHTAHRGDILVSLFDGALRFAGQAKEAIGRRDPAAKGRAIDRLLAILMEFSRTLDAKEVPELGARLQALYTYYMQRAQEAGANMAVEPLDEVMEHLGKMRGTWAEAVALAKAGGS